MSANRIDRFMSRTTLRQIEIMSALHKHGTISRAARALGVSVATVSRASKRFETNLNVRLFEGNGNRNALRGDASEILDCLAGLARQICILHKELDVSLETLPKDGPSSAAHEPDESERIGENLTCLTT